MRGRQLILPERRRRIPESFSWVDHRLVRERHVDRCSPPALALYLFLVTVADADGLSWWSDEALGRRLRLEPSWLNTARAELEDAGLAVYERPVYQVLDLGGGAP